jgi:hypothetical protein
MHEEIVRNFHQLFDLLKNYKNDRNWMFRGHRDPDWRLVPKAGRSKFFVKSELPFFQAWKRRAVEFTRVLPPNDWQWLAVAQHHGFSTRLLDWSGNPLVACFFAVSADNDNETFYKEAILYAFKPAAVVNDTLSNNPSNVEFSPFDEDEEYPIAEYRPGAFAARISRQDARFTIHSPANYEMTGDKKEGKLEKIVIHKDYVDELRKELE